MIMPPRLRKFALTVHVTSSVGLVGAVAGFLALAIAGLTGRDAQIAGAVYPAMNMIAESVIVPLAFASLILGIVQSLGTPWGLFRQYWVLAKLLLTLLTVIVLLFQMDSIGLLAGIAAQRTLSSAEIGLQVRVVIHAAGGLLVLLVATTLSVYKPRGMTRYGARKQVEQGPAAPTADAAIPVA